MILNLDASNWINLGILVATLLAGLLAWYATRKSAKDARLSQETANKAAARSAAAAEQANVIQGRLVALEEKRELDAVGQSRKATLTARIVKDPGERERHLQIENTGPCQASGLGILVNGRPLNDYPEFFKKIPAGTTLGSGGMLDVPFVIIISKDGRLRPPFMVELSWNDDSGDPGKWNSTLT